MAKSKVTPVKAPEETVDAAPKVARNESAIVAEHFDNEADEGATCTCTLTFSDDTTAEGSAPRTADLGADQAAARAAALGA